MMVSLYICSGSCLGLKTLPNKINLVSLAEIQRIGDYKQIIDVQNKLWPW